MPDLVAALFSALPVPATGQDVPEWVHLVPAGTFRGADGRGPYTLADPDGVIKASMAAGKLAIDENHAIDKATPEGRPSPARGWITALEVRSDGLWGRVEWTRSGEALVADHAYRGLSPVFVAERGSGRIVKLLRASLTNDPNLDLTTLHNRSHDAMDLSKLREALGLAADADEAAIIAAAANAHKAMATHSADLARIATAAGLDAKEISADGLVTHLQARGDDAKLKAVREALRTAGVDYDTTSPADLQKHLQARGDGDKLAGTVIELQTKLDALEASRAKEAAERAIDDAIAAGKPIRAMRDHYIARHIKDPAGVAKELAGLPSLNDGGARRPTGETGTDGLSGDQREVCRLMGLDPKKYADQLKAANEEVAR